MPVIHVGAILAITAPIFLFTNGLLLSTYVCLAYQMSEGYRKAVPPEFHYIKNPAPTLFLCHMSILITGFILCVYVYILDST